MTFHLMKTLKTLFVLLFLLILNLPLQSQDNAAVSQRTPEQEAVRQTERLQQELGLSANQARQIYEINLRYARARQVSNTRSEAMERIKSKDAEMQKVLNGNQYTQLQNRRFERRTELQNRVNGSGGLQATPNTDRTYQTYRNAPSERSNYSAPAAPQSRFRDGASENRSGYSAPRGTSSAPQSTPSSGRSSYQSAPRSAAPSSNRR